MVLVPRPRRRDVLIAGAAGAFLAGCGPASGSSREPTASDPAPTARGSAPTPSPAASQTAATPTRAVLNGAGDVAHGSRTGDAVALTFHGAGAGAVTRQVLAALAAAHAQVTVFAVGSWLDAEPDLARLVLDAGHELGNHTYHHLPMRTLGATEADAEVERAAAVLTRLTGDHGAWFRPSGTPSSTPTIRAAARRSGYPVCVSYDVDSLDWTDPGARAVVTTVLSHVRPGSIVSLHLGHSGTAAALPGLLVGLGRLGLRPVTVTELLA